MTTPLVVALDPVPDPLTLLERVASLPSPAFLDGAAGDDDLGRWSYLAWDPVAVMEASAEEWDTVRDRLRTSCRQPPPGAELPPFIGGWIGWLGYELGRAFDRQPIATHDRLAAPDLSLALYDLVVAWNHRTGRAWLISTGVDAHGTADAERAARRLGEASALLTALGSRRIAPLPPRREAPAPDVTTSFTPDGYRMAVAEVMGRIRAGDIFQANLTERFRMPFTGDRLTLYRRLRDGAPGSHAAYLDRGRIATLSMSPERFLRYDATSRTVEARPIKGTRPRDPDPTRDAALASILRDSVKDRAENVMIVDLLRNDIARVAEPDSIGVSALCRLESYRAVHHLVSVVEGTLRPDRDAIDLIAATFPGGSITGAPKLRAMAILAALEQETRGVYCGAIGWFGLDGSLDLNIAIRTVTLADGQAIIGAGGGVTLLSDPEEEYQEVLTKVGALIAAVGKAS